MRMRGYVDYIMPVSESFIHFLRVAMDCADTLNLT